MNVYVDVFGRFNLTRYRFSSNPRIGWWRDRKTLLLYHGTHKRNLIDVAESGLIAPSSGPTAGWVSMALEPNTALGYASMSGESAFRAAGSKAVHVPVKDRIVFVAKVPMKWVLDNMETNFRGNIDSTRGRLTNRSEYDAWTRSDQEYYALTEIRFPKVFPKKYLIGYMLK